MANVDKVIKDLVINEMSQEEFDAQKAAGTIVPNEIYVTPDKTDDKLDKKVSVVQGEENAGKVLVVNENGEVVPDKPKVGASLPILTHVFSDHKLNDISWLNADTFSWQSGDVYKAAYEHLREEFVSGEIKNETIAGITITYKQAEDGHKICTAQQEANIQALYEKTGVAWYYILDADNKQFKLPRTKFGFTGLRDTVGNYVPESLPEIKNRFSVRAGVDAPDTFVNTIYSRGGTTSAVLTSGSDQSVLVETKASLSSSTYQENAPVQQRATQMHLYFYVGNFEQSAVEQTAGLNAELFNGKADRDLNNVPSNYDYVIAEQKPNASNNYTWYKKYKSGWVEQGGRYVNQSFTGGQTTFTATLPIPVVGSNIIASPEYVSGDSVVVVTSWSTGTTANTTVERNTVSSTLSTTASARWVVFGNAQ